MKFINSLTDPTVTKGCALIPTMGALHDGHASLIRAGVASGLPVTVSIFVNPTQFGPTEDYGRYPRTLEADLTLAQAAGATAVFVPTIEEIYPDGLLAANEQASRFILPPTATNPQLEDAIRPTHFGGVCLVVARLFDLCNPSCAFFGEKDFQQLRVITEMVDRDPMRWKSLKIVPCATIREADGLAMSSRNRYLQPEQRASACALWRALHAASACENPQQAEAVMHTILAQGGLDTQYAVIRSAQTLGALESGAKSGRALIAAKLGAVRLIDNAPVGARVCGG